MSSKPESCLGNTHICQSSLAHDNFDSQSCALSIFLDIHEVIRDVWQFIVSNTTFPSQIVPIDANNGRYLLINVSTIHQAINDHKLTVKQGCKFCIYSMPSETSVLFDIFIVKQRIENSDNEECDDTTWYANNLALALHLTANVSKFHLYLQHERDRILEANLQILHASMV